MSTRIEHGGELAAAIALHGGKPNEWIDLSTGINPNPPSLPPIPDRAWHRLPEREEIDALERAAKKRYGAGNDWQVLATPGTQAIIQLLPRVIERGSVAVIGPTYAEHTRCWKMAGHTVRQVAEPEAADIVVFANPNNPDGRRHDPESLRPVARQLLVADEAFADADPDISALRGTAAGVLVLRSFGKFYGLAGLRLGFAIGERAIVEPLREAFGPWAVSGPAIEIGRTILNDDTMHSRIAADLRDRSQRLTKLLEANVNVVGGTNLFTLVHVNGAHAVHARLASQRILVRKFEDDVRLRFGLPGSDRAFERLANALPHG